MGDLSSLLGRLALPSLLEQLKVGVHILLGNSQITQVEFVMVSVDLFSNGKALPIEIQVLLAKHRFLLLFLIHLFEQVRLLLGVHTLLPVQLAMVFTLEVGAAGSVRAKMRWLVLADGKCWQALVLVSFPHS